MIAAASASRLFSTRSRITWTSLQVRNRLFPRRNPLVADRDDDLFIFFVFFSEAGLGGDFFIVSRVRVFVRFDNFRSRSCLVGAAAANSSSSTATWLTVFTFGGFAWFAGGDRFGFVVGRLFVVVTGFSSFFGIATFDSPLFTS
jgi:hypothetical protein